MNASDVFIFVALCVGSFNDHVISVWILAGLVLFNVFVLLAGPPHLNYHSTKTTHTHFELRLLLVVPMVLHIFWGIWDTRAYEIFPRASCELALASFILFPLPIGVAQIGLVGWSLSVVFLSLKALTITTAILAVEKAGFTRIVDFKALTSFSGPGTWPSTTMLSVLFFSYIAFFCRPPFLRTRSWRSFIANSVLGVIALTPLLLSFSRGLYLSSVVAVILVAALRLRQHPVVWTGRLMCICIVGTLLAVVTLFYVGSHSPLCHALLDTLGIQNTASERGSTEGRSRVMMVALKYSLRHPLGAGIAGAIRVLNAARPSVSQAFSLFLEFWLEHGLLGILFSCAFLSLFLLSSFRRIGRHSYSHMYLAVAILIYSFTSSAVILSWSNVLLTGTFLSGCIDDIA